MTHAERWFSRNVLSAGSLALAEIALEKINCEACDDDGPEIGEAQRDGEDGETEGGAPEKYFADEAVEPIRTAIACRNARPGRREEARDGFEILAIALALRSQQSCFLVKDQSIIEESHQHYEYDIAGAAGQQAHAKSEENVSEIKWIAEMAVGAVGDEAIGVQVHIVNDGAVEVGLGPGANERGDDERV